MTRFNWKLFIVLLLSVVALGLTVFGLRGWNRSYRAKLGYQKGQEAYKQGQWEQSAQYLGQYLSIHPDDVEVLMKYAKSQISVYNVKPQNVNQAINAYRAVLRLDNNVEAARNLVGLYLNIGLPGEGELTAQRFLEKVNDSEVRQKLASCFAQQKKYDKAIEQLQQVIKEDASQVTAFQLMAQVVERKENSVEAGEPWFNQAVEKNPDSAAAYIARAQFRMLLGRREQTIEDLQKAETCKMEDVYLRLRLAEAWQRAEQTQKTQQILDAIEKEDPKNPSLWISKAKLAAILGDPEQMKIVADKGLAVLGEDSQEFLPPATELYLNSKQYEQAEKCLKKLRQLQLSDSAQAYFEGLFAEYRGNWSTAAQLYRKAFELGRKDEDTAIKAVRALLRMGDTLAALNLLETFLGTQNDSFRGHLLAGELLSRQNQWAAAMDHLQKAIRLNSSNAQVIFVMFQTRSKRLTAGSGGADSWELLIRDIKEVLTKTDTIDFRLLLFQAAMQSGQKELASQQVEILKTKYPDNGKSVLSWADYLMSQDKLDQASAVLSEYLKTTVDMDIARGLMVLRMKLGDVQGAVEVLRNTISRLTDPAQQISMSLDLTDLLVQVGQADDVYGILKKMNQDNPSNVQILRKLLDLKLETENPAVLQGWIDQIKKLEGEQGRLWRYEQARLWYKRFERKTYFAQIVDLLNENLRLYPGDVESMLLLASCHEVVGNKQLALKSYMDAYNQNPTDVKTAVAAIAALYRANEYRQGFDLLTALMKKGYQDPRMKQLEMQYYIQQGDMSEATTFLEKELVKSPDDPDPQLAMALMKIRQKEFDKAEPFIEGLLKTRPDYLPAIAAKVQFYAVQGKIDQALELCNQTVQRLNTPEAYLLRCQTLLDMGRKSEAKNDIEKIKAQSKNKDNPQLYLISAQLYSAVDDQQQAFEELSNAMRVGADKPEIQQSLAMVLSIMIQRVDLKKDTAKTEQIEKMLNTLIQQDAQNVQAVFAMALMYHGQDKLAEAAKMYDRTLTLNPAQVVAINNLAWLMCKNQNNPQKALELANRGLEIRPDYTDLIDTRGEIYLMVEDYQKAADDLLRCTKLYDPKSIQVTSSTYRLGKAYWKLGKKDLAKETLRQAQQLNQQNGGLTPEDLKELDMIIKDVSK